MFLIVSAIILTSFSDKVMDFAEKSKVWTSLEVEEEDMAEALGQEVEEDAILGWAESDVPEWRTSLS